MAENITCCLQTYLPRGHFDISTERRIRQLTSAIGVYMELGESTKAYLRAMKSKLQSRELLVSVLIDEIYSSKQIQCVNGKFYGNEEGSVTKTLLCFMIKSVAGKYRDIIAMLPCSTLNAKKQYEIWENLFPTLFPTLCEICFDPVLAMTDGNHVNHKFFKDFICDGVMNMWVHNPCNQIINKMFLLFDTVHIFKCFYTNFMKREMFSPSFADENVHLQANFSHAKQLYALEHSKPIKMAYRLSDKVLNPATFEKTDVSLANACFHESTIHGLKYYSKHGFENFSDTTEILQIFRYWFNAVNVKPIFSDQRARDPNRAGITKENRVIVSFFPEYVVKEMGGL